jgi:hypothetical protein
MTIRLDTLIPFGCNSRAASVGRLFHIQPPRIGDEEPVSLFRLLLLGLRSRCFLSALGHPCIVFRRAAARRGICRQATYRVRYKIADMHATARR